MRAGDGRFAISTVGRPIWITDEPLKPFVAIHAVVVGAASAPAPPLIGRLNCFLKLRRVRTIP
jgi:hypothetical protein